MKSKLNFNVCGLSFKYFLPFFAVMMIAIYLGAMPTATIFSKTLADGTAVTFKATTFVCTMAFLMAIGGIFFWLGNTIPIVNKYLGGACLLPLFGASAMKFFGLIPTDLQNGVSVLMKGGYIDVYVSCLLVGAILIMDRKVVLGATARYLPAIIGSQVFALGFCMIGGLVTGFGVTEALFNVGAPCMSGGSSGALTTLPRLYSTLAGQDLTGLAAPFLCYASIANVLAVVMAAVGKGITERIPGLNGNGQLLIDKNAKQVEEEEKRPGTSGDYGRLGGGIFMCLCIMLAGGILASLPVLNNIVGIAWAIIIAIIIKCTGILPDDICDNCTYAMNFMLKAGLPMLIAGIGINSMNLTDLTSYFSLSALVVIFLGVFGAFIGAMIFGRLVGLYPFETGVTAGLCCCNIGGSGDIAVLTAADRMNLLAFASISTRIGGALMVVWIGLLYPLFH